MNRKIIEDDYKTLMETKHKRNHATTFIVRGIDGKLPDGMKYDEKGRATFRVPADNEDD